MAPCLRLVLVPPTSADQNAKIARRFNVSMVALADLLVSINFDVLVLMATVEFTVSSISAKITAKMMESVALTQPKVDLFVTVSTTSVVKLASTTTTAT